MSDASLLHFFGGKGGAGKTTLSLAYALGLADKFGKDKVLVLSFEPNGGLSDVLKKKLGGKPTKLTTGKGSGGLFAAETDTEAAAALYNAAAKPAFAELAKDGALLSKDDVLKLLNASLGASSEPGTWFQILEWLDTKAFDRIVVDGLSTAHTMRLFELPEAMRRVIALARGEKPVRGKIVPPVPKEGSAVDALVAKLERLAALFKDPTRFSFHMVASAEPVGDVQARQLFAFIKERNIALEEVVVNQIEDGKASPLVAGRRGLQAPHVRKFQAFGARTELVHRRILGPRGLEEFKKFAKEIGSGKETKALQFAPSEGPPALVRAPSMPPIVAPPLPPTRFIFFVGQGGVGKSSCAAAAAVTLTEKEGPVLLLSTDPAHSLSEVLLCRLTDTETQVKGTKGLYSREIDFDNWFASLKKRIKERSEAAFGPEVKGQEFAIDRDLVRNLLDLAPVGMDELCALSAVTDALVQERFKRIVIDPTPTSDVMRMLELPAVAKEWMGQVIAVLSKYRAKGTGTLVDDLNAMVRHIERFEKAILNPAEARFVVVTRGDELAVPPAERLVEYLKSKNVPVDRVLVNRVFPKTTCPVTEERRKNELDAAKIFEKKIGLPVTAAPALGRYPAGLRELKAFRTAWYALSATAKVKAA